MSSTRTPFAAASTRAETLSDAGADTAAVTTPAPDAGAPAPGLHLHEVTLEVGDGSEKIRALDEVTLRVEPGEFVAVIGPSGAGKSSLLAVAGALASPTSGTVEVQGQPLAELRGQGRRADFRRRHLGFVFQSGNLVPALTAADQLRLAHHIAHGRKGGFDPHPLLEAVDMGHRANHRPGQLSGGERQRVGIARALVNAPDLLLVDEPTAALDSRRSQEIVGLLARQCHDRGIAGVMVTHDHGVLGHCDRVVEMVDGRLHPHS
ncbi:ABC transporter ATP-binding protein [Kytococcus sedentarius]|uniref:ABC transporter ATP-binding protein n=1 Tax=Kytococcus sedentarius TaxID=1276 RepID=UPI0035BBEB9D